MCHLGTVAVASKGQFRRRHLYWRAGCGEETKVGGASVAVRRDGNDVARLVEPCPANLACATGAAGVQK